MNGAANAVAAFDAAVAHFSAGRHTDGAAVMQALQALPASELGPTLIDRVLLVGAPAPDLGLAWALAADGRAAADPSVLADRLACYARRLFYVLRLLAHSVVRDFRAFWGGHAQALIDALASLVASNAVITSASPAAAAVAAQRAWAGSGLAGAAPALPPFVCAAGRPVVSEAAALTAIVAKLRLAEEGEGVDGDAVPGTLAPLLSAPAWAASAGLQAALAVALVEEFGLYAPPAAGRGVPAAVHEALRTAFAESVLPTAVVRRALEGMAAGTAGGDFDGLAAAARVLAVGLAWRFDSDISSLMGRAAAAAAATPLGMAEVVQVGGAGWQATLEQPSGGGGGSSRLAVFDTLLRAHAAACRELLTNAAGKAEVCGALIADVLAAAVQLSSATHELWGPEARAYFAEQAWTAALDIYRMLNGRELAQATGDADGIRRLQCDGTVAVCLCLRRVVEAMGCQGAVFRHPAVLDTFVRPLEGLTTALISALADAEAHRARAGAASSAGAAGAGDDGSGSGSGSLADALLEALDHLLRAWQEVIGAGLGDAGERVRLPDDVAAAIAGAGAAVLRAFVSTKVQLHALQGHAIVGADGAERPESTHAIEYGNANLQLIAAIARESPEEACPFLREQLATLAALFLGTVQAGRAPPMPLCEALWYVLSVACCYIGDVPEAGGEGRPAIPPGLAALAVRCESRADPSDTAAQVAANPMLLLCGDVFELAVAVAGLGAGAWASGAVSPALAQVLLAFAARYAGTYIMADPMAQADCAPVFGEAFGKGAMVLDAALALLSAALRDGACFDPLVAEGCTALLGSLRVLPSAFGAFLLAPRAQPQQLLGHASWFDALLAAAEQSGPRGRARLPGAVRGGIVAVLVAAAGQVSHAALRVATGRAGGGFETPEEQAASAAVVAEARQRGLDAAAVLAETPFARLWDRLGAIFGRELDEAGASDADAAGATRSLLEALGAAVAGLTHPCYVAASCRHRAALPSLIAAGCHAARAAEGRLGAADGAGAAGCSLLAAALAMLEEVVASAGCAMDGRTFVAVATLGAEIVQRAVSLAAEAGAAAGFTDEAVGVLVAAAKLMLAIATWGTLDMSGDGDGGDGGDERAAAIPPLCVHGLLLLLRSLDPATTALVPQLRDAVFRLFREVGAAYTGAVLAVGGDESAVLLAALSFAVQSGSPDLVEAACQIMQSFATFARDNGRTDLGPLLRQFLAAVAGLVLGAASLLDPGVTSAVGSTLCDLALTLGADAVLAALEQERQGHHDGADRLRPHLEAFAAATANADRARGRNAARNRYIVAADALATASHVLHIAY